jgi:indole-3-glycerol phosphate synthase
VILDDIVRRTEERVALLENEPVHGGVPRSGMDLSEAIVSAGYRHAVIAEIKPASPSSGTLSTDPAIEAIAEAYVRGGCTALSVVTEPFYFGGNIENISRARSVADVPILRKDFIIDERQVYETAALGADAVLLIARLLGSDLARFVDVALDLGIEPLVEIHNGDDLALAAATGCTLIGINNRNLCTMEMDLTTTTRLSEQVRRSGRLVVAESGIRTPGDVRRLSRYCDAFLIGTALMAAEDRKTTLEGFVYA